VDVRGAASAQHAAAGTTGVSHTGPGSRAMARRRGLSGARGMRARLAVGRDLVAARAPRRAGRGRRTAHPAGPATDRQTNPVPQERRSHAMNTAAAAASTEEAHRLEYHNPAFAPNGWDTERWSIQSWFE